MSHTKNFKLAALEIRPLIEFNQDTLNHMRHHTQIMKKAAEEESDPFLKLVIFASAQDMENGVLMEIAMRN